MHPAPVQHRAGRALGSKPGPNGEGTAVTRVALYARYSSDQQNDRSIGDQLAVLTRHAAHRGWTVVGAFTDAAISGSAMANRPGLLNALDAAGRGDFDLLLAEDEDRIARNLEHMAHIANRLEDVGAAIATLSSDRVEGMMIAFKGGMAQDFIRNLRQKTKRGMAANAERGLATGSRLYAYQSSPGGAIAIVEDQAEVVRRIFTLYADEALSPREIAGRLNREGVPSPTGRMWNASTITGSKQRACGILHSEIYAGVKVYGRVEMRKDRQTGRRVTICKPPEEHTRVAVPHLRIIEQRLWDKAQARLESRRTKDPAVRARMVRRPHLLSGLLKCGRCGASYTALGAGRLVCAAYREKGVAACTNRRHAGRAEVERRVLDGLRTRLLHPDAVALYVRAYHEAWTARTAENRQARAPLQRRLGELKRAIDRGVDALLAGEAPAAVLGKKLESLEAEQAELQQRLALIDAEPEPPVQLHPRAAEVYARQVEALQARLEVAAAGGPASPAEQSLMEAARGLIDRVEIEPTADIPRAPLRITLYGTLARFMENETSPQCGGAMVAGGRIVRAPPSDPALKIAV
jgi:site-specific DNA recombinase